MKNRIFNFDKHNLINQRKQLALLVERFTDRDGLQSTAIPSLDFIRASSISEPLHSLYAPSLCIIVQGAKMVILGKENYKYDTNSYLVASVHLPIIGKIIEATPDMPYLSIRLSFSSDQILDIIKESQQVSSKKSDLKRGLIVTKTNLTLLDTLLRLVSLLETPNDIPILAPLFIREILYRVLQDEHGYIVKQFAVIGSHAQSISKAINVINCNFAKPLRIDELAKKINMSPSSLHHHFKKVTAMSPLQYQKQVRLQEARRLLLSETLDAADAGFKVGYESPSQFSREYARMFGLPPISDIKRLRDSIYINF
ncbi:AraC family transcriptional regulator [Clostridium sp.]|jgi:AraC-like DNA-binding protein|uniref:AraC family transcriptional regulator n=1 Tax=Clostridium sp. TaxID=1506 RepID=UPI00258E05D2|nr:AraC family transcriptional regulator [Clostridium sp.]MDF2503511.1 AraC family transcriptional regulator [Clostridium sp.]